MRRPAPSRPASPSRTRSGCARCPSTTLNGRAAGRPTSRSTASPTRSSPRPSCVTDDTGGTPACGNSSNSAEYFHITSTVTSSIVGIRIPAVKIDSLVSPSVAYAQGHGTLGAKIVDRNRRRASRTSPSRAPAPTRSATRTTDQNGCVDLALDRRSAATRSRSTVAGYCDETGAHERHAPADGQPEHRQRSSTSPTTVRRRRDGRRPDATSPARRSARRRREPSKARELSDVSVQRPLKTWVADPDDRRARLIAVDNAVPVHDRRPTASSPASAGTRARTSVGLDELLHEHEPGRVDDRPTRREPVNRDGLPAAGQHPRQRGVRQRSPAAGIDRRSTSRCIKPSAFATTPAPTTLRRITIMDWPADGTGPRHRAGRTDTAGWVSQDARPVRSRPAVRRPTRSASRTRSQRRGTATHQRRLVRQHDGQRRRGRCSTSTSPRQLDRRRRCMPMNRLRDERHHAHRDARRDDDRDGRLAGGVRAGRDRDEAHRRGQRPRGDHAARPRRRWTRSRASCARRSA